MTTIATDGKTVAADGLLTSDNRIVATKCLKLRKIGTDIVGLCGLEEQRAGFEEFIRTGNKVDGLDLKGCSAFVVNAAGVFAYDDTLLPVKVDLPCAMGSGGDFALGAMRAGASPIEAVKIAVKTDIFSGGRCLSLNVPGVRDAG